MSRFGVACLCLLLATSPSAFGWGREGHKLIAQLATQHLNSKARAEVARLLGPNQSLESIASWADEVRPQRKETGSWHYINIPIKAERADWQQYCPESGCVVRSIGEMSAKLRDRTLPDAQRAEALKFLVHFTGDVHQPLHAGDNGDRGGNDVQVVFLNRPTNLHSVWDTPLLEDAAKQDPSLKKRLARRAGYFEWRRLTRGAAGDWAWESQKQSRDAAYRALPQERPAVLGKSYEDNAIKVVKVQIRSAGLRLARQLNETLGK